MNEERGFPRRADIGFVSGHGFSRAARSRLVRALAPEGTYLR
jgi:hypothetical protein